MKEDFQVASGFDRDARQIDCGKRKIAPAVADRFTVPVADDPGPAAHIGDFGIVIPVKGGIHKGEGRIEPLGRYPDSQLEQIVIGVLRLIIDPLFHPEDDIGKDRGFSMTQAFFIRQQQAFGDHPPGFGGVAANVQTAERHLGSGPAMHGVEVID